jgi:hypothetical protein
MDSSNELLLRMELARLLRYQRETQLAEFNTLPYLVLVRYAHTCARTRICCNYFVDVRDGARRRRCSAGLCCRLAPSLRRCSRANGSRAFAAPATRGWQREY